MRKNIFKLNSILGLLILLIIVIFVLSGVSIKNTVLALSGNYNKNIGESLNTTDWNNLDNDFIAKSGDTMQGDLNMNNKKVSNLADPVNAGDAVNKGFMDSSIAGVVAGGSASIKNIGGESLKMVCGTTPYGSTNWTPSVGAITLLVDTSSAGFANNEVFYFVSLYGDNSMYRAVGQNAIYEPGANGFRIYLNNNDISSPFVASTARDVYKWYIKWCGIGQ